MKRKQQGIEDVGAVLGLFVLVSGSSHPSERSEKRDDFLSQILSSY